MDRTQTWPWTHAYRARGQGRILCRQFSADCIPASMLSRDWRTGCGSLPPGRLQPC